MIIKYKDYQSVLDTLLPVRFKFLTFPCDKAEIVQKSLNFKLFEIKKAEGQEGVNQYLQSLGLPAIKDDDSVELRV